MTPPQPPRGVPQDKELRKIIKEVNEENKTPLNQWRRRQFEQQAEEERNLQRLIKVEQPAEYKALDTKLKDVVNPAYLTPPKTLCSAFGS